MSDGIVVAGGGLAAQRCAETLRSQGYDGAIRIVCAEAASAIRPATAVEGAAGRRSAAGRGRVAAERLVRAATS